MGPFGQLFWGYVLFIFSFTVAGVDILEILGYLYIAHVLRRLIPHGVPFRKARILAFYLAGLPLLAPLIAVIPGLASNALPAAIAYVGVQYALHIVMTLLVVDGLSALAVAQDKKDLIRRARYLKVFYPFFSLVAASTFVVFVTRTTPEAFKEWLLPLFVSAIIPVILILLLFRKADRTLILMVRRSGRRIRPGARRVLQQAGPRPDAGPGGGGDPAGIHEAGRVPGESPLTAPASRRSVHGRGAVHVDTSAEARSERARQPAVPSEGVRGDSMRG